MNRLSFYNDDDDDEDDNISLPNNRNRQRYTQKVSSANSNSNNGGGDNNNEDFIAINRMRGRVEELGKNDVSLTYTPIGREFSTRDREAVRTNKPVWEQEARDEHGQRRFHGAFTGGFSAGYFNTVGSAEGWTPTTFVSSRSSKAKTKEQTVDAFMDDEDRSEMLAETLTTTKKFGGFFTTADEIAARKNNNSNSNKKNGDDNKGDKSDVDNNDNNNKSGAVSSAPRQLLGLAHRSMGLYLLRKMGLKREHNNDNNNNNSSNNTESTSTKVFGPKVRSETNNYQFITYYLYML